MIVKRRPCLYISVTPDKYRFPVKICDTPEQLARECGVNLSAVYRGIGVFVRQERAGKIPNTKYEVVRL